MKRRLTCGDGDDDLPDALAVKHAEEQRVELGSCQKNGVSIRVGRTDERRREAYRCRGRCRSGTGQQERALGSQERDSSSGDILAEFREDNLLEFVNRYSWQNTFD